MKTKYRKIYIEWWKIKRSTIYGTITLLLLLSLIGGGLWWAWRDNWFADQETADVPPDAGRLISFEGDVRIIRAATRETILVTKATYVSAGDTIQTQGDGRATVQMIDGSTLAVRPNSTVVIRDSSSIFGGKNVRVTLDDGQINVRTEQQPENTKNVVEVMESENRIYSQTDASFNINPTTNGGEIRISRGGIETSIGAEKTIVKENEFALVNNGKLASKEKLLDPPKLTSPANSAQIVGATNEGANATFRWQNPETGARLSHYLQISKSPFFTADSLVVERDALTNTNFTLGNIPPGIYYWRIRGATASGQTSNWSEPFKFTVVRRESSPRLEAGDWQVEEVGGNIYIIGGRTQPGAVVRSQGRETFALGDGSFRLQVSAASPDVAVEISDERGNRGGFTLSLTTARASRRF